jgi:hypothetical protein
MKIVVKLVAALALVALLAAGVWLTGSIVATSTGGAIALGAGWLVACAVTAELVGRRRTDLRRTLRGTLAVCMIAGLAGFYCTPVRVRVVDVDIVTGVPASQLAPSERGSIDPLAPQP